jgi:hypothetical protein
LLGLSLDDATLKHLLRHNEHLYPGHYHYYVAHVSDGATVDSNCEKAVVDSNFAVYNLITLFLTNEEIAAIGELLGMERNEFKHLAEDCCVPITYRFLLTGPVSVGKSTAASNFRSLRTHDEWLEQRLDGMEKDPEKLAPEELEEIDDWVARQLDLKNKAMLDVTDGIHIVDRAPLDAFAFIDARKWQEKAARIRKRITGPSSRKVCDAHVILLIGDPQVMAVRSIARHKEMDAARLSREQSLLQHIYGGMTGVSIVDTRDKTVPQVAKEVANIIYRYCYSEASLDHRLTEIENGAYGAA